MPRWDRQAYAFPLLLFGTLVLADVVHTGHRTGLFGRIHRRRGDLAAVRAQNHGVTVERKIIRAYLLGAEEAR